MKPSKRLIGSLRGVRYVVTLTIDRQSIIIIIIFFFFFFFHFSSFFLFRHTAIFLSKRQGTFVPPALISSAFFGSVAFYTSEPRVKQLAAVAAVSMFATMPWTLVAMLPVNKSLAEMESAGPRGVEGKEDKAVQKVKMWRARHLVRIALAAVGWVAGVAALEIL